MNNSPIIPVTANSNNPRPKLNSRLKSKSKSKINHNYNEISSFMPAPLLASAAAANSPTNTVDTTNSNLKSDMLKLKTDLIKHKTKFNPKNQTWDLKASIYNSTSWEPDSTRKACSICNEPFTFFNRRHHCRFCGKLICGNCSKMVQFNKETLRSCEPCIKKRDENKQFFTNIVKNSKKEIYKCEKNMLKGLCRKKKSKKKPPLRKKNTGIKKKTNKRKQRKQTNYNSNDGNTAFTWQLPSDFASQPYPANSPTHTIVSNARGIKTRKQKQRKQKNKKKTMNQKK